MRLAMRVKGHANLLKGEQTEFAEKVHEPDSVVVVLALEFSCA